MKISIIIFSAFICLALGQYKLPANLKGKANYCLPTDENMKITHQACLLSWRELFAEGGTVERLRRQCPNFCDHNRYNCAFGLACKRCHALMKVCAMVPHMCLAYIKSNEPKTDPYRCPQYELCYPGKGHHEAIRKVCEDMYSVWKKEADGGATLRTLSNPCSKYCIHDKEDCGWRIVCKKCNLWLTLPKTPLFRKEFDAILAKDEGKRCTHYHGPILPYWWITENWI